MKKFAVAAVAAVVVGWAGTASATPILISSGGSYSTDFFWAAAGANPPNDLTAILDFDIATLSPTQIVVDFKLTNTTVGVGTITAFGFSTDPDASGVAGFTTGSGDLAGDADVFDNFAMGQIPALASIEVCMQAGPILSQCSGGGLGSGLAPGAFDGFRVTLTGTGFADGITSFDNFGVKFQGPPDSFEFYSNGGGGGPAVPEPVSIALLGSGWLAFLSARALRKKV